MNEVDQQIQGSGASFNERLGIVVLLFVLGAGLLLGTEYPAWLIVKQQQTRSFVPVPARVLDLKRHVSQRRNSREVYFTVVYEYSVGSRVLRGSDITLEGAKTHRDDLVSALDEAKRQGTTVTAWVDPASPERAVLERSIDTVEICLTTALAAVWVTFSYWVLYLGLAPKEPRAPQVFFAFPFARNVRWRTYWVAYLCTVTVSLSAYLVLDGSPGAPWMLGMAALSGLLLKNLLGRRRFFAKLGLVEIRWLTPLNPGQQVELQIRLSRPERLEDLELELTCTEFAGKSAPGCWKDWFKHQFSAGDFRRTSSPDIFSTTVLLPAEAPPTKPAKKNRQDSSVTWTLTLKAPSVGKYVQSLTPVVGAPSIE